MKTGPCCAALIILTGAPTSALAGPYTIENRHVVMMSPDYQTTIPIGNGPHDVYAIEFSVDGFIYGVNSDSDTLVRIDPATGISETVGPLGIDLGPEMLDLDEDVDGQLWIHAGYTSGLYTLDRETGAASLFCVSDYQWIFGLASIDGTLLTTSDFQDPPDPGCDLEYVEASGFVGVHLEIGPDGWIHALGPCSGWWSYANTFSRFNPATGTREYLGTYYSDSCVFSLTFDPTEQPTPAPIPTVGWPGRVVLTLLLSIAGFSILTHFWTSRG